MSALAAILASVALAAAQPPASGPWILSCDIPASGVGATQHGATRTFRLAPGLFQEWKADIRSYGTNLCVAFTCQADRGRLTGTLESASARLTITVDPAAGRGQWKTAGASNLPRTEGVCTVKPEKKS